MATPELLVRIGKGGGDYSKGSGDGYQSSASTAGDASDVKKAATFIDATPFVTGALRRATRVHREAADAGPHT